MNVIIIEDEIPASQRLIELLREIFPECKVLATLVSVDEAIQYLTTKEPPDIIFADIELNDGQSFRIFNEVKVHCPVIFTTAYDQFRDAAFQQNSIEYLLKPVKRERLASAIQKYFSVRAYYQQQSADPVPGSFLIRKGSGYLPVEVSSMAYFFAFRKLVFLVTSDGNKHVVPFTLNELESELDKLRFCRVNRKFIVQRSAVRKVRIAPKSKLVLEIDPLPAERVMVSYENSARIKRWISQH